MDLNFNFNFNFAVFSEKVVTVILLNFKVYKINKKRRTAYGVAYNGQKPWIILVSECS
jgi:hypothetical protein